MNTTTFQSEVRPWLLACFGVMIAGDKEERNHRFLEESLELVQACGCSQSEAHQLVDYVFSRPVGEPPQEVGGVMVTLAALCLAHEMDMHECGNVELARIWTKVEAIRAKQAAKPKHSPLPSCQPDHIAEPRKLVTPEQAHAIGAKGAPPNEEERLLFEAWMRGHCWALSATWDGRGYRSDAEQGGDVSPPAMRTRQLWAAWRDRAALGATSPPIENPSTREAGWKQAVMLAYGHLWHVNNEPMAPIPLRSPEKSAYEARKLLREMLTKPERGEAINQVAAILEAAKE